MRCNAKLEIGNAVATTITKMAGIAMATVTPYMVVTHVQDLPGAVNDEQVVTAAQATGRLDEITAQEEEGEEEGDLGAPRDMKIAWRYRNMPQVQSSFSSQFGHNYDLTVGMPAARIEAVEKIYFNAQDKPMKYVCTVCMYVCVYALCMYTCVCVCMYVCVVYACTYTLA